MNDLIRLACERAAQRFGDKGDGLFCSANFSLAFADLAGVNGTIDGKIVRAMLTGRRDVRILRGSHFRLLARTR